MLFILIKLLSKTFVIKMNNFRCNIKLITSKKFFTVLFKLTLTQEYVFVFNKEYLYFRG